MATREELITGLEVMVREARRVAGQLSDDQWSTVVDIDGWKSVEVLAHVAGVGSMVIPVIGALADQKPGGNIMAGMNIDQLNAGMVAQRAGKTAKELSDEIAAAYGGVIEYLRTIPEDTLQRRASAGGHKDLPVSDLLVRMIMMHGLGHIYSVYSAVFFAGA